MELWNEYEGSTIAGSFRLERLLRPEGRSAFFSTTLEDGRNTVIRLIESHYDDDAILARWNAVTGLKQEHLLGLTKFGHVVMDDTSLVYVVMEPSDADLGQILRERALTVAETRQLAESLVAALAALHAIGMVHEHLQPINVLAVGETVKLRSDCIREAPEGAEGEAAHTRDVYDLCLLLLQALTLERNPDRVLQPAPNSGVLPSPFREILYNGLSGRWTTMTQVAQALAEPVTPTPEASGSYSAAASPNAADRTPAAAAQTASSTAAPSNPPVARLGNDAGAGVSVGRGDQAAAPTDTPVYRGPVGRISVEPDRTTGGDLAADWRQRLPMLRAGLAGAALLAGILLLWHLAYRPAANHAAANQPMQTLASMRQDAPTTPTSNARPQPASVEPRAANADWRVIAFTYNQPDQAQAKVDRLAHLNPNLHFEVFSPHGHAPYLVAVNGYMTREQALALRSRLRGHGFPSDIYAQNFERR